MTNPAAPRIQAAADLERAEAQLADDRLQLEENERRFLKETIKQSKFLLWSTRPEVVWPDTRLVAPVCTEEGHDYTREGVCFRCGTSA